MCCCCFLNVWLLHIELGSPGCAWQHHCPSSCCPCNSAATFAWPSSARSCTAHRQSWQPQVGSRHKVSPAADGRQALNTCHRPFQALHDSSWVWLPPMHNLTVAGVEAATRTAPAHQGPDATVGSTACCCCSSSAGLSEATGGLFVHGNRSIGLPKSIYDRHDELHCLLQAWWAAVACCGELRSERHGNKLLIVTCCKPESFREICHTGPCMPVKSCQPYSRTNIFPQSTSLHLYCASWRIITCWCC